MLPVSPPLRANEGVQQVAVGSDAVFAVTTAGRCLAWGSSLHGKLGADDSAHMEEPEGGVREVEGLGFAVHVVCGAEHSLALNSEGAVFAWGSALAGRLGIGARAAALPCRAGHLPYTRVPERIEALQHRRIVGLACSDLHCLALSAEGEVYSWGSASMGRLGVGSDALSLVNGEALQPMLVKRLQGCYIVQVVCAKANSACLSVAGDVFSWGATSHGLASCPRNSCAQEEPGLLLGGAADGNRVTSLAMGKLHALALSASGVVFSWGWAGDAALGLGPATDGGNLCRAVTAPTALAALAAHPVRQIACGDTSSFAVTVDSRLVLWGTVPVHPSMLCPVQGHSGAVRGAGDWQGADDHRILWPSFLARQPAGWVSLPSMGGCTSALLIMCMLPPHAMPAAGGGGDSIAAAQERENSRRLANVQPDVPAAGGCKRKSSHDVGPGGYGWERRLR